MAKELHFNKNMEALKKLQAGVDKLSSVVGVTLGPKVLLNTAHELSFYSMIPHTECAIGSVAVKRQCNDTPTRHNNLRTHSTQLGDQAEIKDD